MSNSNDNEPPLRNVSNFPIKTRVYWGISSFGTALVSGIYGSLLSIFYTDYLGLSEDAYIINIVSLIYLVWNAFNDPLFGFLSDKTKSDKGRRIPFMRYTAPFLGLTFALIWWADPSFNDWEIFAWMLTTMLLYDTAYTIIGIVYSALLPEITEHEQGRNQLQVFANFFYLLGTIIGFILPDMFRHEAGDLLPLRMAMIGAGVIAAGCVMFTTYKFKERPEFAQGDDPLGLIDSIKYTFKSKSFLILTAGNFMSILTQSLVIGSMFYLADYVTQSSTILLLICIFLPLILGIWFSPKMIEKWGVVRSDQILLVIGGIGLLLLTILPGNFVYLGVFLGGVGLIGPLQFTNLMYAQVADEDELETGVRREAAFFGVNALLTKPAQSFALMIPAALLSWASFIPRSANEGEIFLPQPEPVYIAIKIFIGLIPGIALLLEALIFKWYPLKGDYLKKIQKEILVLHEEKHNRYYGKKEPIAEKSTQDR